MGQTLTPIFKFFFELFYVFFADVYRNEGNEAFKKGDFINAIHFYTKGIYILSWPLKIQRSNLLPQISVSMTSFSQNYSNGSWFATCMANQRYLFQ